MGPLKSPFSSQSAAVGLSEDKAEQYIQHVVINPLATARGRSQEVPRRLDTARPYPWIWSNAQSIIVIITHRISPRIARIRYAISSKQFD